MVIKDWATSSLTLLRPSPVSFYFLHIYNKVSKACILVVSETIWNCREKMKIMSRKYAFWRYLNRFGTVGKRWKHEIKDAYTCNMIRFDYTIFWHAEKFLKAMKLNGAFWRFLRLMLDDIKGIRYCYPPPSFLLQMWTGCFCFLDEV